MNNGCISGRKMKCTVDLYGWEIGQITMEIKRMISRWEGNIADEELMETIENVFFQSEAVEHVEPEHLRNFVLSVYSRARWKYGILNGLLNDDNVNEIMVNGPDQIFAEKNGRLIEIDDAFTSPQELENLIRLLAAEVHREINEASPIVDARMPDGSRVNGVLRNVALNGPILTIRKFSRESLTMDQMTESGTLTLECRDFLADVVKAGYNIFISGGTSSGKTTFLNALCEFINPKERVIIIEDSSELRAERLSNKIHMECRASNSMGKGEVTMDQLIRTSLRMRPDRIIVGEVRGKEVVEMIQAMNTGHDGSISTGHGNDIRGMLNRLESMYMSDAQLPVYSVKSQIANAIDLFIHLRRDHRGVRQVMEIAELVGFDGSNYQLNYLFTISDKKGKLEKTGNRLVNDQRLKRMWREEGRPVD
jgi:pilus assembly protein CpaF